MSPWALLAAVSACALGWSWTAGAGGVSRGGRSRAASGDPVERWVGRIFSHPVIAWVVGAAEAHGEAVRCLKEVPQMLDIVCLALSAGLSFDGAIAVYGERVDSPLSRRLSVAKTSWQLGLRTRAEALEAMAGELDVASLTRFAATVEECLRFGMPLADTLRRQSQAIRDEQRQQIEEEVERIPVRMLLPLGCFVVPAMLLAIVGPLLAGALT